MAPTDCSATGSTSTFHTSAVSTTHSARLQRRGGHAGGELGGLVEPVVGELDGVGDPCLLRGGRGVGAGRDRLAGEVDGDVPVQRAVVGLEERLQLAEELAEVGQLPPAPPTAPKSSRRACHGTGCRRGGPRRGRSPYLNRTDPRRPGQWPGRDAGVISGDPTHSSVPSANRWCFQIGTSSLRVSMSARDASKDVPRWAEAVATTTAASPICRVPVRCTAASACTS